MTLFYGAMVIFMFLYAFQSICMNSHMFLTHRIPITKAYVNPSAVYESEKVTNWLVSPQVVEQIFAEKHGESIPMHYIELFENDMKQLSDHIRDYRPGVFSIFTEILSMSMYVDKPKRIIMLKAIFLRPCAEKYGFFRIILYQISRCCILNQCDFYVETPFESTRRIMQKAFGLRVEDTQQFIPHMGIEHDKKNDLLSPAKYNTKYVEYGGRRFKTMNYMVVRYDTLLRFKSELATMFGLVNSSDSRKNIIVPLSQREEDQWGPLISCNRDMFPPAYRMNHGAGYEPKMSSEALYPNSDFQEKRESEFVLVPDYSPFEQSMSS
jgi:hypothetical protein